MTKSVIRPRCFQSIIVIETELPEFHKMCATVMKMYYNKQKPSIGHYHKFKNFWNDTLIKDVKTALSKFYSEQYVPFKTLNESVNITFDKRAPLMKRYIRGNQFPFMNKRISKEIMKRSCLRNKFLNTKSTIDRTAYNKQRNHAASLLRNEKNEFLKIGIKIDQESKFDNYLFLKNRSEALCSCQYCTFYDY